MAFIPYIEEDQASEALSAIYDRYRVVGGPVDNVLRIHGHNPPSLTAHALLYQTLLRGASELSRVQREMIAVIVSTINQCRY